MGINRRNFLKTLGVIGTTLTVGNSMASGETVEGGIEFKGLLYDTTRCLGCHVCERLCAKVHGRPEPEKPKEGELRNTDVDRRCVINTYNTPKGEVFSRTSCMHCNQPACASACLTQAMYKTKEGAVIWRGDKCMGCRYCMVSCPFDVPKFEYHSSNPMIVKCDMCYGRIKMGGMPTCAAGCPGDALTFGTRRELLTEARKRILENPKDYADYIYGETEAGGTGFLSISSVMPEEIGLKTGLTHSSYPALSKGFLYSVPAVFVLLPPALLGIYEATKSNKPKDEDHE